MTPVTWKLFVRRLENRKMQLPYMPCIAYTVDLYLFKERRHENYYQKKIQSHCWWKFCLHRWVTESKVNLKNTVVKISHFPTCHQVWTPFISLLNKTRIYKSIVVLTEFKSMTEIWHLSIENSWRYSRRTKKLEKAFPYRIKLNHGDWHTAYQLNNKRCKHLYAIIAQFGPWNTPDSQLKLCTITQIEGLKMATITFLHLANC